mgnify:FL=1
MIVQFCLGLIGSAPCCAESSPSSPASCAASSARSRIAWALRQHSVWLVLAFLILGISAWCARSRLDVVGLALHLIASSGTIWLIAVQSTDDALTPVGFSGSSVPYFSQRVGYLWLIGCIVVQLMLMFLPARWFAITPKTDGKTDDKTDDKNSQQPSQLSVSQQTPDTLAESR